MDTVVLSFSSPGTGQVYDNAQWVAEVQYDPMIVITSGRRSLFFLTVTRGSLGHLVGRSGVELRTVDGLYHSVVLPRMMSALEAQAIILS